MIGTHGYEAVNGMRGHPLDTGNGQILIHRLVLWNALNGSNAQCNWCGKDVQWSNENVLTQLIPDHIDFNKLNNDITNLVPACRECNNRRTPNNPTGAIKRCGVDLCDKKHLASGLCGMHWARKARHGSVDIVKPRKGNTKYIGCMIEYCNNKHHARGYCAAHYMTEWYDRQAKGLPKI